MKILERFHLDFPRCEGRRDADLERVEHTVLLPRSSRASAIRHAQLRLEFSPQAPCVARPVPREALGLGLGLFSWSRRWGTGRYPDSRWTQSTLACGGNQRRVARVFSLRHPTKETRPSGETSPGKAAQSDGGLTSKHPVKLDRDGYERSCRWQKLLPYRRCQDSKISSADSKESARGKLPPAVQVSKNPLKSSVESLNPSTDAESPAAISFRQLAKHCGTFPQDNGPSPKEE
jgi:hypothetical protein